MRHFGIALITLAFVFIQGCSNRNNDSVEIPRLQTSKLLSDRGIDYVHGIVMLRLQNPPLLKTASRDSEGKIIINEEAKKAVIAEQAEVLTRLKKISDKIELVYSYKLSINGIAVLVPAEFYDQVFEVEGVSNVVKRSRFDRVSNVGKAVKVTKSQGSFVTTTADFLGASNTSFRGKGIKVAVFDTGIDYTHAMFKGPGTVKSFESVDPTKETDLFPNSKVVGGIDLVGETFSPWSVHGPSAIPRPDSNPIDQSGHGSHVAGTIAGIGDGINSFDGIAPEADLYAIKVFGAGGTGDDIVIAGVEWCLDPNGDYDLSDMIDVGNMSLGGGYGRAYNFYNESIANATEAGFIVVTSAGNSGPIPYIVGSPGTTESATAVGATVGGMEYLWQVSDVVKVDFSDGTDSLIEYVEGAISKPLTGQGLVTGEVVFAGVAATDFSPELSAQIKGKIALIDRGEVSFVDKLKRANDAGAIGVIVANNRPGDAAFVMGGEGQIELPGVMITKEEGDLIKSSLSGGSVSVSFNTGAFIEKPELIDTITGFSSQGPRLGDGLFKPEVTAPGFQVISASVGTGQETTRLNGTSMAAPQVAGAMALLKEAHPTLTARNIKSLLIGHAKTITDVEDNKYPLSRQGAGRVQIDKSINAEVFATPATLSLGHVDIIKKKTLRKEVSVQNITDTDVTYSLNFEHEEGVEVSGPQEVTIAAGKSLNVEFFITLTKPAELTSFKEFDLMIKFMSGDQEKLRVPALGVMKSLSDVTVSAPKVASTSALDSVGAVVEMDIKNANGNEAVVELFNLIGIDDKKPFEDGLGLFKNRECDLKALGHRIVERNGRKSVQFGVKLYEPTAVWDICEISIQIDNNGDNEADLELGGALPTSLAGLTDLITERTKHFSILVNTPKAKEIRLAYEEAVRQGEGQSEDPLDYKDAVLGVFPMTIYNQSSVAIVEVDIAALGLDGDSDLSVKVATLAGSGSDVDSDDFFGLDDKWHKVSIREQSLGYLDLPETISLKAFEQKKVRAMKGLGTNDVLALVPMNLPSYGIPNNDKQMFVLKPSYLFN